jgi:hypothetical protein
MTSSKWGTYFSNSNPNFCGISQCSLYEDDCTTAMSDPISMDSSSPWDMKARKDIDAGYTQIICIECSNGVQRV